MKLGCLVSAIAAFFVVAVVAVSLVYVAARHHSPVLVADSYVEIELGGELSDYDAVTGLFARSQPTLQDYIDLLELAEKDEHVAGVVAWISPIGAGWAKVEELHQAFSRVRAAGKDVVVFLEYADDPEYYLATAANRIVMAPMGTLGVDGLSSTMTYFRGIMDKVGVAYEGASVGEYKSAPEQLTRTNMSEPSREQTQAILDGLYEHYRAAVAEARHLTVEAVDQLVEGGPYEPSEAKKLGLIDEVLYRDEFKEWVREQPDGRKARLISAGKLEELAEDRSRSSVLTRTKLAVVFLQGAIVSGEGDLSVGSGATIGDVTVAEILKDIRNDYRVKAVVLRIDSPGGSVLASDNIWREIMITRNAGKPVIVSMGDLAASGGYYIAAAADMILAQPGTITGSIGIFGGKMVTEDLFAKVGIGTQTLRRGAHADMNDSTRRWTAQERARIQTQLEESYGVFTRKVAEGRGLDLDVVGRIARGRVWLGSAALRIGLVDELGGLPEALEAAAKRIEVDLDDIGIDLYPRSRSFLEDFLEDEPWTGATVELPAPLEAVAEGLRPPPFVDGEALALLPFQLQVR